MTTQSLVQPPRNRHMQAFVRFVCLTTLRRYGAYTVAALTGLRARAGTSLLALMVLPQAAWADLPTVNTPTAGSGGSGLLGTLQGYAAMAAILLGLLIATSAFFVVGGGAIGKFNEARQRNEWGAFATTLVIGVGLIVAILWLANKAVTIL